MQEAHAEKLPKQYASHREALQGRADDFLDAFPLLDGHGQRNALRD